MLYLSGGEFYPTPQKTILDNLTDLKFGTGIRLSTIQNFRKLAVLFSRYDVINFVFLPWLFTREQFIVFQHLPRNSCLMMPKSLFNDQKWFFWQKLYPPTYFSHFWQKEKFSCLSLFVTSRWKKWLQQPPGGTILLKLSDIVANKKTQN